MRSSSYVLDCVRRLDVDATPASSGGNALLNYATEALAAKSRTRAIGRVYSSNSPGVSIVRLNYDPGVRRLSNIDGKKNRC